MKTLFEDKLVKLSALENAGSEYITLCFTGIGHKLGGIDVQREEFLRASHKSMTIFVIDKQRSWGNNLDFGQIAEIVKGFGPDKKIYALGNSMGGFIAILASKFIKMDSVVTFVPQYSVHKSIFPDEHRYDEYVDAIHDWKYMSLEGCFVEGTNYYIISGYGGEDDKHLDMIPNAKNIHKIYFTHAQLVHNTAAALSKHGLLYEVIGDGFAGRDAAQIIAAHLTRPEYGAFTPEV